MGFKLILIFFTFSLISCSSNNPKDYWDLEEPVIHFWDTDANARVSETTIPASEFKTTDVNSHLGYNSFIVFPSLPPEIKFSIQTSCTEAPDSESSETLRTYTNTSNYERSDRLYFYDFLPKEVLVDNKFINQSFSYLCDYKITAINAINSKILYQFDNLKINTSEKNEINIYSKQTDSDIRKSIAVDPEHAITDFPSLYLYEGANLNFEMGINLTDYKLTGPGYIKCMGHENINLRQNNNLILLNEIVDPLKLKKADTNATFLKKCRIITNLDSNTNLSLDAQTSVNNSSRRTVWSEYFNVVFEKPELEINIEHNPELRTTKYPFNYETYLDSEFVAFKINFKNRSKSNLKMRLPSLQKIEAQLNPLVYFMQLPGFKPVDNSVWGGLRTYQLQETFNSEIKFFLNGVQVSEFNIEKDAIKTIDLVMYKKFKCTLPVNNQSNHSYKTTERGFRVQALPLDSEDDKIIIDYQNMGQLESFPETFSFNKLLENANTNLQATRVVNLNGNREDTNFLQMTNQRTHVIDTLIFRSVRDIIQPEKPIFSFGERAEARRTAYYLSSDWDMHEEIRNIRRSDTYPSQLRLNDKETNYCSELQ